MTDHRPVPTSTKPSAATGTSAAARWLVQRIQTGWERATAALLRAEARIMENFRVPPGGG